MRTRVKICGLTREQDVRAACELGADAVGFVCYEASPRFVEAPRLAALAGAAGVFVTPVLLFVNADPSRVREALAQVPTALLQFHGDEDAGYCQSFGRPYLRALAVGEGVDLLKCEAQFPGACALLADTPSEARGGTGQAFDWSRVPAAPLRRLPLVLAGGLEAGNVAQAIARVRPYAVDVSSGVEQARGIKSAERIRDFLAAVRQADAEMGAA